MKKIGEYTARGQLLEGTVIKIILFDGQFDTAYKVTKFEIWAGDISSSSNDVAAKLSTVNVGAMPSSGDMMNAADNREIAWSAAQAGTAAFNNLASIVDPDNLVVEDLYVTGQSGGTDIQINYLITMEKYDITDSLGALAMVRNRSQT